MRKTLISFAGAFFLTLTIAAIAYAATVSQIWRAVHDDANNALRVVAQ